MRRATSVLGFVATVLFGLGAVGAQPEYTVTNMNHVWAQELEQRYLAAGCDAESARFNAHFDAYATSMHHLNSVGQMAGSYKVSGSDSFHPVFWDPVDGLIDLEPLREDSYAMGMNDLGQVVGQALPPLYSGKGHFPFLWSAESGARDIADLAGVFLYDAAAYDINVKGQVVGRRHTVHEPDRDFFWDPVLGMRDLDSREWDFGFEMVINDAGQIAGTAMVEMGDLALPHAVVWDSDGRLHDIHPDGYVSSKIYDINNLGQLVGDIDGRACVWEDGQFRFVEGLEEVFPEAFHSSAWRTNNRGQIVGAAGPDEAGDTVFWLSDGNGQVWAVQDLLPADAECDIDHVYDLNDQGWILAQGFDADGRGSTFLLKPVAIPEPSIATFLLSGLVAIWLLRERRG